uniref:Uncharacterized protein n=1 Tax=Podoviridae sp. ct3lO13 TaxID=2826538 RepID=A0A8S5QRU2_9CAUD|nr:MAG TPA: hypothetical protein [Podoviridae sp. ct3lO13]
MAIRTREEILESIRNIVGDSTDDNTLKVLEDVTDTFTDFENKTVNQTDWEAKYKENDEGWRKKYAERFYTGDPSVPPKNDDTVIDEPDDKPTRFDELFTTE